MAELTQAEVVYSPRSIQVWWTLLNWLAFFFQIFAKFIRALGHHPLLSSSASTHAFKPLPITDSSETDFKATVEIAGRKEAAVGVVAGERIEKLTDKRPPRSVLYAEQELVAAKGREQVLQEQLLKEVNDSHKKLKKQLELSSELQEYPL